QHHDGGAEADSLGAAGEVAQEIERRGELSDAGEVVLDHERAVVAELLGIEHVVDVLAVAETVADGTLPRRLGAAEQSEPHWLLPSCWAGLASAHVELGQPWVAGRAPAV